MFHFGWITGFRARALVLVNNELFWRIMELLAPISDPADDDWRLHATARLADDWVSPWTGQLVPKGSRITVSFVVQLTKKRNLTIPLPNATALLLNSSENAFAAARSIRISNNIDNPAQSEVAFNSDKEAFDYLERMIEAVVLAFTALEAFVNESVPEDFLYTRQVQSKIVLEATNKSRIERNLSIDEKLISVLPEVLKCSSPKGSRSWQSYRQLKKTRDRLIHMKTEDRKSSGAEVDTVWKALFITPAPHLTVKAIIDYFARKMATKPGWLSRFPVRRHNHGAQKAQPLTTDKGQAADNAGETECWKH